MTLIAKIKKNARNARPHITHEAQKWDHQKLRADPLTEIWVLGRFRGESNQNQPIRNDLL